MAISCTTVMFTYCDAISVTYCCAGDVLYDGAIYLPTDVPMYSLGMLTTLLPTTGATRKFPMIMPYFAYWCINGVFQNLHICGMYVCATFGRGLSYCVIQLWQIKR